MPTVPHTYGVPVDSFVSAPGVSLLTQADILSVEERTSGPTPDPDTDDVVLLPADQGNAVSQPSLEQALPQTIVKPRIDLGSLNLHSPSSIVGTPFDISPRFEYPFPAPACPPSYPSIYGFDPVVPTYPLTAPMASRPSIAPPIPLTLPPAALGGGALPGRARGESRSFSPTHPKLQPRDPPVPPSLAKKRKLTKPAANDVGPSPAGRPRAGSTNNVPERLDVGKLANEQRGRALDCGPGLDGCSDADEDLKDRSQSLDTMRVRAPSQRHADDVIVAEQTRGGGGVMSHMASSSRMLPLDLDRRKAVAQQPPRPASVPRELFTRSPLDEQLRSALLVAPALRVLPQDSPSPSQ
ncbi:hypothetical protein C8Q78DRAFT_991269 [Trametes maxima]|nr:hypothetical protein C8Q78DRAFT_991269 [Trametes maxima]